MVDGNSLASAMVWDLLCKGALVLLVGVSIGVFGMKIFSEEPEPVIKHIEVMTPYEKPEKCQEDLHEVTEWEPSESIYHQIDYPEKGIVIWRVHKRECRHCNYADYTVRKEIRTKSGKVINE